jgi:hypothetical protein
MEAKIPDVKDVDSLISPEAAGRRAERKASGGMRGRSVFLPGCRDAVLFHSAIVRIRSRSRHFHY